MTLLLGPAAAYLALHQASARTDASREALRAAGIGTTQTAWCHPISDVVKSHEPGPRPPPHYPPGTAGTCCANGICVVGKRRPVQAPATFSTSGVCSPVGAQSSIDNALALVDSAVEKVTCWTAPIPLPTDEGDVDISPLLGTDNKNSATDTHRDRLHYELQGNEFRLYLSSQYCDSDDVTISALQTLLQSRAKSSCIELKVTKRSHSVGVRKYVYIECKCKHRSSDGQVESSSKEYAEKGDVYAANISQGRKDHQSRKDIQENGARGHKSNAISTPKCSMYFSLKYDEDKSRWYVTVGSGCSYHFGHKQLSPQEMIVKKKSVPKPEEKIVQQLKKIGGTAAHAKLLLYERTGLLMTDDQINNMFRQVNNGDDKSKTSAELAIEFCESADDVEYVAIYHRYDTQFLTENSNGKRFKKVDRFEVESSIPEMTTDRVRQAVEDSVTAAAKEEEEIRMASEAVAVDPKSRPAAGATSTTCTDKYSAAIDPKSTGRSTTGATSTTCTDKSAATVDPKSTCRSATSTTSTACTNKSAASVNDKSLDARAKYCKAIRDGLSVDDKSKVLLSLVFIKKADKELAVRFPEVFYADVTMQTNSEARPMFAICGKDSDNRTFTALRGFLPSQRRWVFHWLWETAIPTLLKVPPSVIPPLERNEVILTDNDEKEWGPLEGCLADDSSSYSSKCKCRTCSWHLTNRGLKSHPLGATKTNGAAAQKVVETFTTWIYSWMMSGRGVETKEEYLVSRDILFTYLESKSVREVVGDAWCKNAVSFVKGHVIPYESHYANYQYHALRTFDACTTSVSEIENSATKRTKSNPNGVAPNQSLPHAMCHMTDRAAVRQVERDRRTAAAAESTATWSRSPTAAAVTPYAETIIMEQYLQHGEYFVHKVSETRWWVLRRVDEVGNDGLPVPKFKRVREVKLVFGEYLTCSCFFYERYGIPCRHLIAVNDLPSPSDIAVRWHRKYSYYYGREGFEEVTVAYNAALRAAAPGPRLKAKARDQARVVDDAILEEMTAVVQSPCPVLVGHWAGVDVGKVQTKSHMSDGVYVKSCELSKEGGFEQMVSLFDYGEQEMSIKNTYAYKDGLPILTDMADLCKNHPDANQVMIDGLNDLHSKVLKFVEEGLKRKRGGDLVGSGDGGIASSGIDGLDTSAQGKRLRAGGENGSGK